MQAINQSQVELITQLNRVRADLATHNRVDNFYDSLAQAFRKYGSLTERQEAALRRSLAQYNERNARIVANRKARVVTSPIPTGRVTITGKVISTKWVENDFGGALKMLVESDQGWRVYGTVPRRLADQQCELVNGTKVAFTAEVTPKEADFGFFSRPTGGAVLKDEHPEPEVLKSARPNYHQERDSGPDGDIHPEREPAPSHATGEELREEYEHNTPIAPDLKPEDLLAKSAPAVLTAATKTAPKLSLTELVAAAGY